MKRTPGNSGDLLLWLKGRVLCEGNLPYTNENCLPGHPPVRFHVSGWEGTLWVVGSKES